MPQFGKRSDIVAAWFRPEVGYTPYVEPPLTDELRLGLGLRLVTLKLGSDPRVQGLRLGLGLRLVTLNLTLSPLTTKLRLGLGLRLLTLKS